MRISSLSETFSTEFKKLDAARRADKQPKVKVVDSSEISSKAQTLSETKSQVESIASQIAGSPDVRTDKIAEVQQKINSGYYNSPEFIDKLAGKLMQEFGLGNG